MLEITPYTSIKSLLDEDLISRRTFNRLSKGNMFFLWDIVKLVHHGYDLKDVPQIGPGCANDLKDLLLMYQQANETRKRDWIENGNGNECGDGDGDSPKDYQSPFDKLDELLKGLIYKSFMDSIPEDQYVSRCISLNYHHAGDWFDDIALHGKDALLRIQPGISKKGNTDYRLWQIEMLQKVLRLMEEVPLAEEQHPLYHKFSTILSEVGKVYKDFSVTETIIYFISARTDLAIQKRYEAICTRCLSRATSNFKDKYLYCYKSVVDFFDRPIEDLPSIYKLKVQPKVMYELHKMIQMFRSELFDSFVEFSDLKPQYENELLSQYPFLDQEQALFVENFMVEHCRRPFLYLAYNFICSSRGSECFQCRHYNELMSVVGQTTDKIYIYQLNRINVRGLLQHNVDSGQNNMTMNCTLQITDEELQYYRTVLTSNIITEDSEEFKNVVKVENLPDDFLIFGILCPMILDYEFYEFSAERLLLSCTLNEAVDFKYVVKKFNQTYSQTSERNRTYLFHYFTGDICGEYYPDIIELLTFLSRGKSKISITESTVVFGCKKPDINTEVYEILTRAGYPMSLDEIFERFKTIYPDHELNNPSQLEYYISQDTRIIRQGNNHRYGLSSWRYSYYVNIQDFIFEMLKNFGLPMHQEILLERVQRRFPSVNPPTFLNVILNDPLERFEQFEKGFIGLAKEQYPAKYKKAITGGRSQLPKCYSFEQRLERLRIFIETNHRFPFYINGESQERLLAMWLNKISNNLKKLSEEESIRLNALLDSYADPSYPRSKTEHTFRKKCIEYKRYIQQYRVLPPQGKASKLHMWFLKARQELQSFQDHRKDYFMDLCDYIASQGFSVAL